MKKHILFAASAVCALAALTACSGGSKKPEYYSPLSEHNEVRLVDEDPTAYTVLDIGSKKLTKTGTVRLTSLNIPVHRTFTPTATGTWTISSPDAAGILFSANTGHMVTDPLLESLPLKLDLVNGQTIDISIVTSKEAYLNKDITIEFSVDVADRDISGCSKFIETSGAGTTVTYVFKPTFTGDHKLLIGIENSGMIEVYEGSKNIASSGSGAVTAWLVKNKTYNFVVSYKSSATRVIGVLTRPSSDVINLSNDLAEKGYAHYRYRASKSRELAITFSFTVTKPVTIVGSTKCFYAAEVTEGSVFGNTTHNYEYRHKKNMVYAGGAGIEFDAQGHGGTGGALKHLVTTESVSKREEIKTQYKLPSSGNSYYVLYTLKVLKETVVKGYEDETYGYVSFWVDGQFQEKYDATTEQVVEEFRKSEDFYTPAAAQ